MPEFRVYTKINAPYDKVWENVSVVGNVEKWAPVKFHAVAPEEHVKNGMNLIQLEKQFGMFGRKELYVADAYTDSKVRRQYSFVDKTDAHKMNRITYMFDDNSISTMIALSEDPEARRVLEEQAKTEPKYQIDVMAHVYYSFGSTFLKSLVEFFFINPFFKFIFEKRVKNALNNLKVLSE